MSKQSFVYWIIGLFAYFFILLEFFHPITAFNQDLGRHLLMGKIILQTHSVPKTNLFSYTYPNFPFINTHWLSEVIFYLITQAVGLPGLLFIMSSIAALAVVIIILPILRHKHYAISVVAVLIASGILLERTDLRPEIFSFFFMSIFMTILWKNRAHATKWLFLLPLIELLWVNMHIYFIVGPILIGLFLLDSVMLNLFQHLKMQKIPKQVRDDKLLFLIFLLTCTATLVNPNGFAGALYPFTVFHNYGYTIAENQNIFFLLNYGFRHWSYVFFGLGVLLLFILLIIKRKQTRPIDWLLGLVFAYLAASAIRNLPLFVFATLPTLVSSMSYAVTSIDKSFAQNAKYKLLVTTYFPIGIFFCFGFMMYLFISTDELGFNVTPGAQEGVDFFIQNHLSGPIFNNFDIGSYLDYRLYPTEQVFVDGRPEAYPADFFQKVYIPMQQDPTIFKKVEQKYHFQTIFFSYTDQTPWAQQFLVSIMQDKNWQLVFLDSFSAIWVLQSRINQPIIQKFAITQQNVSVPNNSQNLLYFFHLINWPQAEMRTAQKMLDSNPNNCQALGILVQNPTTSTLFSQRFAANCQ